MASSRDGPRGTRRLRRHRHSLPSHVYHVTTATFGRSRLFDDFRRGRLVVDAIRRETESGRCNTYCFVVMPDHLHWLMQLADGASLSGCVNNVKAQSARRIRKRGVGLPRIWQKGFYDHVLRSDEDLLATARYIIANPVRAGLVERVGEYPLWDAMWV